MIARILHELTKEYDETSQFRQLDESRKQRQRKVGAI